MTREKGAGEDGEREGFCCPYVPSCGYFLFPKNKRQKCQQVCFVVQDKSCLWGFRFFVQGSCAIFAGRTSVSLVHARKANRRKKKSKQSSIAAESI